MTKMCDFLETFLMQVSGALAEVRIADSDIRKWAGFMANWEFYNSTALRIAQKYQDRELSYEVCDRLMNDLWSGVLTGLGESNATELPEPFYGIYEAFDAGEYHRKTDISDDPIANFTDPMIFELLRRHRL
ncbi:hypothetical protein RJJ65_07865 [Rhizobium hidalgonense]|uniref:Uncharacterized protein n=3 Tax=Rhizobium hidalgonense TaxID=1538159 RepID=A0AAJ2GUM1_9HYPH|nr:hypothetical protein [Rhizobium hidalgonense]MDR9772571.1 hypothetical protein [Rhizobium hidalgonense]MDR9813885.1 hypothetical protein [Rhizobium hidalgonense]MDR9821836.1 hypothetical protein [Rhizobium hidalgonense]